MLMHLAAVVTTACNLRCGYCYQHRGAARRMPWEVLRAACDLLLGGGAAEPVLALYGGEPLLALDLMRRAAAHLDAHAPPGVRPRLAVSTNGTLIDDDALRLLSGRRVRTGLSFDGVAEAQRVRGDGTFAVLDALVGRLAADYPGYFADDVTVSMTLSSANLRYLAASVRYFLDRRVPSFTVTPIDTHDPGWSDRSFADLDRQLSEAATMCCRHLRDTGTAPFRLLSRRGERRRHTVRAGVPMCRIGERGAVCVDIDGEVTACGAFARSVAAKPTGLAAAAFAGARLGHIFDRDLPERIERGARALRELDVVSGKERKHSPYATCATCTAFAECRVCPLSIVSQPDNNDPDAIPPLPCAFNLLAAKHRRRFPAMLRPGFAGAGIP